MHMYMYTSMLICSNHTGHQSEQTPPQRAISVCMFRRCTSRAISVCMFRRCTSTTACCGRSTSTASSHRARTTAWYLEIQQNKYNSSDVGEFLRTGGVQTK